ncbi:MAG: hypothetical protein U0930_11760 [Pirellulales bacterium]
MKFSIRYILIFTAILAVPISLYVNHVRQRERAIKLRMMLQRELDETNSKLRFGKIYAGQTVDEYLQLAKPCEVHEEEGYVYYEHGFTGPLSHGTTIVAKDKQLVKAYFLSCVGGEEFFNVESKAEKSPTN